MNKTRKGFTIVELVIVIAVIAILAAVLMPTFTNIINKANTAADMQIVANLNKALATEKAYQTGADYLYPQNAFAVAKEYGYSVEKIVAKSNLNIAYDHENKRFVLLDETNNTITYPTDDDTKELYVSEDDRVNYFVVRSTNESTYEGIIGKDEDQNVVYSQYSIYAGYKFNATKVVLHGVGFDSGSVNTIEEVVYENNSGNAKDVVIRTNSYETVLTVNDESTGSIKHYDVCGSVNIIECHTASYHEYGTVPFVEIAEGHIVLETGAEVNAIHVDKEYSEKPSSTNETGTKKASEFGNVEITVPAGVEMPKFSRDSVEEIAAEGTTVCTIDLANEKNDVILYYNGIYEQIKIKEADAEARWVDTSDATEATKTAADQLANDLNGTRNATTGKIEDKQVTVSETDYTVSFNETTREFEVYSDEEKTAAVTEEATVKEAIESTVYDGGKDAKTAQSESRLKGTGTESDPYLVGNANEWYAMCTMYEMYPNATPDDWYYKLWYYIGPDDLSGVYVKITNDIDFAGWELPSETAVYNLHIDGNNKTLKNVNSTYSLFCLTNDYYKYSDSLYIRGLEIKDFTFEDCSFVNGFGYYLYGGDSTIKNVKFKNCTYDYGMYDNVYGQKLTVTDCNFENCNGGVAIAYGSGDASSVINVTNVDINNSKASSGAYFYYLHCGTVNLTNCDATNMVVSGGANMAVGGFIGNAGATVTIDNCTFGGSMSSTQNHVSGFVGQSSSTTITNSTILAGTMIRNLLKDGTMAAFGSGNTVTNENGNKFLGTASTTNIAKCSGYTFTSGVNWIQHNPIVDGSAVFSIDSQGNLTYTGNDTYATVKAYQQMNMDYIGADNKCISGGYPWYYSDVIVGSDISNGDVIGQLPYITNVRCIVTDANDGLHYSTKDTTLIENADFADDYYGTYVKNGIAVIDSRPYPSGKYYCFAGCENATAPAQFTVAINIQLYDSMGGLVNTATISYVVTPSND